MIERREVDGRMATIAYFGQNFVPMSKDSAPFVKILFDDGEQLLLSRAQLPASEKLAALRQRVVKLQQLVATHRGADEGGSLRDLSKKEWDESKHPRLPRGSERGGEFTSAGGAQDWALESEAAETDKSGPQPDGSFHVAAKTKNELREMIHGDASTAELDKHPVLAMARTYQDTLGQTIRSKDEITTQLLAFRQFNDGVIGYAAATEKLIDKALSYSTGPVRQDRVATVILGPPASGKSGFAEQLAARTQSAIVDSDDAKKMFPEFRGGIGANSIHEESSRLAGFAQTRLMARGANMIIPKLGAKASSIADMTADLKAMGYTVNLVNMDVHPEKAYRRGLLRFINTGRLISAAATAEADGNPTKTYNKLKASGNYNEVVNIDNNHPEGQHVVTEGQETVIGRILGGTRRTRH